MPALQPRQQASPTITILCSCKYCSIAISGCYHQLLLQAFANFARAVLEPSMAAGLKESGRQEQEISQLLEVFFERMTAAAVADPQPASYPATRVLLRRR